MKRASVALVASLSLFASAAAWAADVPVSYIVDDKELKNAVSGTNLNFDLYSDSVCASQIHDEVLAIDDVLVSRLKRFKPSGGAKPPKTAELRATLTGVTGATNIYLEVTGTGVVPVGGACQAQAAQGGPPATCADGITNQDETDVDCGGSTCSVCQSGEACLVGTDCAGGVCTANVCTATCSDNQQNQDETDVDCGGSTCVARCQPSQGCSTTSDCDLAHPFSIACVAGQCAAHCSDGQLDGTETDVDCGGSCATVEGQTCAAGQNCLAGSDCQSSLCSAGVCQP
jgi:hypothetical protein